VVDFANTSSLVLVHGIGGHWKESWGYENFSWVKEFLQPDLEHTGIIVDIWSYGYESRTKTNCVANVDDVARGLLDRLYNHSTKGPIIFVAHSLGGLVVKQVIIRPLTSCTGLLPLHVKE
jgi:pimeloyl-ACP methyl ester carboxylesterase